MAAEYRLMLIGAAAVVAFVIVLWLVFGLNEFLFELRRLNMEIARTDGEEQKAWRALRRRLWLSLLPFVRY